MDEQVTVHNLDRVTSVERPDDNTLIVEGVKGGHVHTIRLTKDDAPWGYMKLSAPYVDNLERELRGRMESNQKD